MEAICPKSRTRSCVQSIHLCHISSCCLEYTYGVRPLQPTFLARESDLHLANGSLMNHPTSGRDRRAVRVCSNKGFARHPREQEVRF
jgi:hypothetical protein